ncbi:hypothetical protein [Xanthobacter sp.]|uniref:hypothetical protein n=1 Tax=Xanthobacter sp. TaxID=35809 RepID=UPI0025E765F5|nr:hypothetical protein [Xanthobacter sp.]
MAFPAWPAELPCQPEQGSWTEAPNTNSASFAPDVGPTIDRRRSTMFTLANTCSFVFTRAEYCTFRDWYRDDLKSGTLAFTFAHPMTGELSRWKFDPKPGWSLAGMTNRKVRVAVQLRQMP